MRSTTASSFRSRIPGDPGLRVVGADPARPELAELSRRPWLLRVDASTLKIRPSAAADLAAVAGMHRRCSARSLLERYRAGGRPPAVIALDAQVRNPLTFVAEAVDGDVVAVATAARDPRHSPHSAEVGILVEDGWQRLGIATELMGHLAGAALVAGFTEIVAYPGPEPAAAQRLLIRVGRTRMVPDDDMHLHTALPEGASLGLGAVRERLAG